MPIVTTRHGVTHAANHRQSGAVRARGANQLPARNKLVSVGTYIVSRYLAPVRLAVCTVGTGCIRCMQSSWLDGMEQAACWQTQGCPSLNEAEGATGWR